MPPPRLPAPSSSTPRGPFLYLVEGDGRATRYGIAIGREGFGWTGSGAIARSAQWPRWTPPPEMIERDPHLAKWKDGQPGGVANPLGARALYIYFDGRDSGYRIHGTNTPKSIGWAASSGCFRMLNQDVIDLYDRVQMGAKVVGDLLTRRRRPRRVRPCPSAQWWSIGASVSGLSGFQRAWRTMRRWTRGGSGPRCSLRMWSPTAASALVRRWLCRMYSTQVGVW